MIVLANCCHCKTGQPDLRYLLALTSDKLGYFIETLRYANIKQITNIHGQLYRNVHKLLASEGEVAAQFMKSAGYHDNVVHAPMDLNMTIILCLLPSQPMTSVIIRLLEQTLIFGFPANSFGSNVTVEYNQRAKRYILRHKPQIRHRGLSASRVNVCVSKRNSINVFHTRLLALK